MSPEESLKLCQAIHELTSSNRTLAAMVEEQTTKLETALVVIRGVTFELSRFASQIKDVVARAARAASDSQELDVSHIRTPLPPKDL